MESLTKVLSRGHSWEPEDLEMVANHIRNEKPSSDLSQADLLVADESDEASPEVIRDAWDWMHFGPAPQEGANKNEKLSAALKVMSLFYRMFPDEVRLGTTDSSNEMRALNARRLWNTVRALPVKVTSGSQLLCLPGVNKAWADKIDELLRKGELSVQTEMREATECMKLFRRVLWTGKKRAFDLYASGCRTLEDVKNSSSLDWKQKLGLQYFDDINTPIPRKEVEAYGETVRALLNEIDPMLTLDIFGSYARGEDPCCDVDFLISHAVVGQELQGLTKLVAMLQSRSIVQRVLNPESNFAPRFGKKQSKNDEWWKARPDSSQLGFRLIMTLARLTPASKMRRVDFFLCSRRSRAAMTLYLTGNVWFNRKLRQHAEHKKGGYLLCNSVLGRIQANGEVVPVDEAVTERDIFRLLDVAYVEPKDRMY